MEDQVRQSSIEPPRGFHGARVDDKGRLKLPADFQRYLSSLGEQKVFITTLDIRTARIYPISVWKENEFLFEQPSDDPAAAEDVAFIANSFGGDSDVDAQGRVLMPAELRRALALENQQVWLDSYKGRINVYNHEHFESRKRQALENLDEKRRSLEKRGLK